MGKGNREEEVDEDATINEIVTGKSNNNKKRRSEKEKAGKKEGEISSCSFPMSRIKRIIKSEDSSVIHISQHSLFLINKASEKFLELFCKEAYACANKKKQIEYKHLSAVVGKRKRFDFLSDFVPEKVQAGVVLAEISSAET